MSLYIFDKKLTFFWSVFSGKLFAGRELYAAFFTAFSLAALIIRRRLLNRNLLIFFAIFLITPLIFYTFFQGNSGNLYDYYLSGYYLPFILIFSIGLTEFARTIPGKVTTIVFLYLFLQFNGMLLKNLLTNSMDSKNDIKLGSQIRAVNWIFNDGKKYGTYNVDVYVPPVIPYAYDYLLLWQGTTKCGDNLCGMVNDNRNVVYVLYEQDPPHPERLEAWMLKYINTSQAENSATFGGITVERRIRLNN
jgi:hypothetical protein